MYLRVPCCVSGDHLVVSRKYGCGFRNIVVYLLALLGSCWQDHAQVCFRVVILIYHLFTEGRANQGYAMRFWEQCCSSF